MASRHASTGAEQKRLITYGMPSRRRHHSNTTRDPQSSPTPSRISDSSEKLLSTLTTPGNRRPLKAQTKRSASTTSQRRTDATDFGRDASESYQRNEELRKRNHSMAFSADIASEITASSSKSGTPNPSICQPSIEGSHKDRANCSQPVSSTTKSTVARGLEISYTMDTIRGRSYSFDPNNSEVASKRHVDLPGGNNCVQSRRHLRRPRLIDALTAQRANSPEPETPLGRNRAIQSGNSKQGSPLQQQSPVAKGDAPSRTMDGRGLMAKGKRIKLTYSQTRGILSSSSKPEASDVDEYLVENDIPLPKERGLSDPPPSPSISEDIEDTMNPKLAIQSVHELRRAGANNRFSDEMDDLLFRIGSPTPSPTTMRRNGLCELAHMLQSEDFSHQFRDHASRDTIAKGIRGENDIISGFALAAVLVIFLSSDPAPHMLRQLAEDGIGLWVSRLLDVQNDISMIAAQRPLNVPRATRTSLASVKRILAEMQIWHGYKVLHLSPRTMALQLLGILIRCSDAQYVQQLVVDLSPDVAKLVDYYAKKGSSEDVDFALTISILEAQSSLMAVLGQPVAEMQREGSNISIFVQRALQQWPGEHNELDATLLKLAINTTNNETGARAFGSNDLLSSLVNCICSGFIFVLDAMRNSRFESDIYDELLLILGIMINILEHCPTARTVVKGGPLQSLVTLWLKNQLLMNEADSFEKSKLSVALGYLAVLLGYLFLAQSSEMQIKDRGEWPSINNLVKSIQEFIIMYKSIDSRVYELEGLVDELVRYKNE